MSLSPSRLDRFARHIVLPEVGGVGQVALAEAHVVLVGCGGIGSPALQYLVGAGVGRLTLIDSDVVEISNLQRQTIFTPADVGRPKAEVAADWVARFDPALRSRAVVGRLGEGIPAARELEDATRFHSWIHARKNMRGIPGNKLRSKIERRQLGLARPR